MRGAGLALALLLLAGPSHAAWSWLQGSAISDFDEADIALLEAATRDAFAEAPDGERREWRNTESGNRGAIKPLLSFEHDGRSCRRMAFLNVGIQNGRGVSTHTLCAEADGTLAYLSPGEHP